MVLFVSEAIETLDQGVVALAQDGRILLANATAAAILGDYFGHWTHDSDHLPEEMEKWAIRQAVTRQRTDGTQPTHVPFEAERPGRRLRVRLLQRAGRRILLLEDRWTRDARQALQGLNLTARESEVLACVVDGKTNAEAGIILGASARTIAKHLNHIYAKLGVENRAAAISVTFEHLSR